MAEVGRNPARIIPAWQDFLTDAGGAEVRGVGEPIWAGRSPDALIECERHEALLNVAFEGGRPWQLLCPYDEQTLDAGTLREARRNHPLVRRDDATTTSDTYPGVGAFGSTTGEPLQPAPRDAASISFAGKALGDVRTFAGSFAASNGFEGRSGDVRLVAQELSSNGVRHGGGKGTLRIWTQGRSLIVEVRSHEQIADPLAGRHRPVADTGGYGLWIVNQLVDLVQIRNDALGSTVRAHFA
jgi:anti-sigma regulatory factor (Ser/Thr protein kinase)